MKKIFSGMYYGWLCVALIVALYQLSMAFHLVWLGVLVVVAAPLLNKVWCYDSGESINQKVRFPKVSLLIMVGMAWVLLTLPERGWPLWLALGGLGGFLLHTYWAVDTDAHH
jgi:hypothetical protein